MSDDLDLRALHQRREPDPDFRADLRRRVVQIMSEDGPAHTDRGGSLVDVVVMAPPHASRRRPWPALLVAAAAAVVVVVIAVVTVSSDESTAPTPELQASEALTFARAIEASGELTSPSPDQVSQAMDRDRYGPNTGQTQVSATGNYVSLRTCRFALWGVLDVGPSPRCPDGFPAGWAFEAGTADGVESHSGLLGAATSLEVFVLDDSYFVAMESEPDPLAPPAAWLIDAVSGKVGPLRWRDTPTTLRSPAQSLLVCVEELSCFLPRVVDARDGTIQPLAVPNDAAAGLPVAQHGTGRIWVGTDPDGGKLGLAYSDNGGETWTDVVLPPQMAATGEELANRSYDKLFEIAADGDRVAVISAWDADRAPNQLYISDDVGRSWKPAPSEPAGNGAHLYVLADRRLVLMWSIDPYPQQVLVSAGTDWAELQQRDLQFDTTRTLELPRFSVNQAGVALSITTVYPTTISGNVPEVDIQPDVAIDFSADLTNWKTL